jgi:hypothetical protein
MYIVVDIFIRTDLFPSLQAIRYKFRNFLSSFFFFVSHDLLRR